MHSAHWMIFRWGMYVRLISRHLLYVHISWCTCMMLILSHIKPSFQIENQQSVKKLVINPNAEIIFADLNLLRLWWEFEDEGYCHSRKWQVWRSAAWESHPSIAHSSRTFILLAKNNYGWLNSYFILLTDRSLFIVGWVPYIDFIVTALLSFFPLFWSFLGHITSSPLLCSPLFIRSIEQNQVKVCLITQSNHLLVRWMICQLICIQFTFSIIDWNSLVGGLCGIVQLAISNSMVVPCEWLAGWGVSPEWHE